MAPHRGGSDFYIKIGIDSVGNESVRDRQPTSGAGRKGEQEGNPSKGEVREYVPGEILVKFREDTSKKTVREISNRLKLGAVQMITGEPLYVIRIIDGASVDGIIQRLKEYPEVEHSEPNNVNGMQ